MTLGVEQSLWFLYLSGVSFSILILIYMAVAFILTVFWPVWLVSSAIRKLVGK